MDECINDSAALRKSRISRFLVLSSLFMLLTSCQFLKKGDEMRAIDHPSPNYNERTEDISMIVIHYTALPSCSDSLARLCETNTPNGRVSSHYLVDTDGTIYRLVDEKKRAWHAGLGSWRGIDKINDRSIGIEIQNIGLTKDGKREPFPERQIEAVITLCKDIKERYGISNRDIIGHSDSAPARKIDPGEMFPWHRLSDSGIGIWTDKFVKPTKTVNEMLVQIGYDISDTDKAFLAFQMHFYPEGITENAPHTLERMAAICSIIFEER